MFLGGRNRFMIVTFLVRLVCFVFWGSPEIDLRRSFSGPDLVWLVDAWTDGWMKKESEKEKRERGCRIATNIYKRIRHRFHGDKCGCAVATSRCKHAKLCMSSLRTCSFYPLSMLRCVPTRSPRVWPYWLTQSAPACSHW